MHSQSEHDMLYKEIETITDPTLHMFTHKALSSAPSNFWDIPASSSGKYHPEESRGEGGLVRHILGGLYFIREYCIVYTANRYEEDCCIAAMILHDIGKAVAEPHDIVNAISLRYLAKDTYDVPIVHDAIAGARWHMGKWATGSTACAYHERGSKRFPEDFSRIEQIVHIADMAVSRNRVNLTKLGA